jgi:hypothetical protein
VVADLTLVAEHRRGHGAMYDALGHGRLEPPRLRRTLASLPLPLPLPRAVDGRIVPGRGRADRYETPPRSTRSALKVVNHLLHRSSRRRQ